MNGYDMEIFTDVWHHQLFVGVCLRDYNPDVLNLFESTSNPSGQE